MLMQYSRSTHGTKTRITTDSPVVSMWGAAVRRVPALAFSWTCPCKCHVLNANDVLQLQLEELPCSCAISACYGRE